MFAFVTHFYSFSYDQCMRMPIRAFFSLYEEGVKIEARHYRELLDIQAVSIQTLPYYEAMREKYQGIIFPQIKELPPPAPAPQLDMSQPIDRAVVKNIFQNMKRGMGYGR